MAESWESKAIQEAGKKWAEAKAKGDTAGMAAASAEANRLRSEAGYSMNGSKSNSDVRVSDQAKWKSSGTQKQYESEVHGIGSPKSISQSQYNQQYGPGGTIVDNLNQKVAQNSAKKTTAATTPTVGSTTQPTTTAQSQNTAPAGSTVRTIYKADGTTAQGYIKNGTTYYMDGTPLQNGDAVIDDNGKKWVKGDTAQNAQVKSELDAQRAGVTGNSLVPNSTGTTMPTTYEELYLMLQNNAQKTADETAAYYEKLLEQQQAQIDYTTQAAIKEQQAQLDQSKQDAYEMQKQAYIQSLKDQDNLALQAAARGDAGGIGLKQYSDSANTYDKQVYEINLQLKNLEADVAQKVADLKAQGEFEAANYALEIGMAQIKDLQNQRDTLQNLQISIAQNAMNYNQQSSDIAFDRALQRLQLGAFSAEDAKALGISDADAERIANQLNITAQIDLKTAEQQLEALKSTTGPAITTETGGDDGNPKEPVKKVPVKKVPVKKEPVKKVDPIIDTTGMSSKQKEAVTQMNSFSGNAAKTRDSILRSINVGNVTQDQVMTQIQFGQKSGNLSEDQAKIMMLALLGVVVKDPTNYGNQIQIR
ncbi:MAG: hypothetical protein SOW50_07270 [Lachnospiraceae bacterium]|nr:hypothetical protein [Lachnospiraceae bacterium]